MILLDPNARPIIAHRGASADAPENTLEAFALAGEQGADAFELDVHVTRDDIPVVIHDPTLRRTAGRPDAVREQSLAAIQQADAGSTFVAQDGSRPWKGRGVRVPTLADVLRWFPEVPMLLEIKTPDTQGPAARVLEREGAAGRCVVASLLSRALEAFRRPPFLVGASRRDILGLVARSRLGFPSSPPGCLLYAVPDYWRGIEVPRPGLVAEARRHGRPVHVWTVDDPARAAVLRTRGVSGIITNAPGKMRDGLGRSGMNPAPAGPSRGT
jgi:glycerophosphoryl diester phosphodiesterase